MISLAPRQMVNNVSEARLNEDIDKIEIKRILPPESARMTPILEDPDQNIHPTGAFLTERGIGAISP
jgi:hypothetical protein